MKLDTTRALVWKNLIASRSHTMPTVRSSSPRLTRSSASDPPGSCRTLAVMAAS